ncbi:hypothetical protein [Ehrlichia muris]|uniref:hypothetical protein n=1 Tax=Ehrlichia muris TaxID=35795 RepID=UPI0037BE8DB9
MASVTLGISNSVLLNNTVNTEGIVVLQKVFFRLSNIGTGVFDDAVNGTVRNSTNGTTTVSTVMNVSNNSSLSSTSSVDGQMFRHIIEACMVLCFPVLLFIAIVVYKRVSRYRGRVAQNRRAIRYLREHGPGPDVPDVIIALDVIHDAQNSEDQNQCVESRPFVRSHSCQENDDTDSQARSVFRLQEIFPR